MGELGKKQASMNSNEVNPLQHFCLENPMDRGAWQATVHEVTKSRTQLKGLCMHACMCEKRAEGGQRC